MKHVTHSAEESKVLAADFAQKLKGGECIVLVGDLGSGKTTFTQGLAAALGSTAKVKSPTFTLMNIYPTHHATIKQIVHIDYYRVPTAHDDLALEDYDRPDTIIVTEWPTERDQKKHPVVVRFAHGTKPDERTISF